MIDYDAIRAADEQHYQQYRASLDAPTQTELDAAGALVGRQGRSLTQENSGRICHCTWEAHAVRHALGAVDAERWFEAILIQERQGQTSLCCYAAPQDEAQWQEWQDEPLGNWGTRHLTSRGVLQLAAAYGRQVGQTPQAFFCEECRCSCGRQSEKPGGGFCVRCRTHCDLWTNPEEGAL